MKKLVLITIAFMMVAAVYAITPIHVTKPAQNETIFKGSSYMIKWVVTGQVHEFVKISLFDKTGNTQIYKITDKTPSANGQFPWPKNMLDNTNFGDYMIMVKTLDNNDWDLSGVFHIRKKNILTPSFNSPKIEKNPVIYAAGIKRTVKISSPVKNGSYEVNKPMTISWNKNLGTNSKVNIYLCTETNDQGEKIFTETTNSGNVQWIPPGDKVSWPGNRPYIKIVTPDNVYSGKSGLFSIVPPQIPPPPSSSKKTIARTPSIQNQHTHNWNTNNKPECLYAPTPGVPGRAPTSAELKTGHHISEGKYKQCSWVLSYTFTGDMIFDLGVIKGKEILRAELLITLSDHIEVLPPTTNETCSSMSRMFDKNGLVTQFHILTPGHKTKINLLNSVKQWAASSQSDPYTLTIKDIKDVVNYLSVCLKYYSQPILFVDYK